MEDGLQRDVRRLKGFAVVMTIAFGVTLLAAFQRPATPQNFEEINVERINIIENDGKLRMVISNEARQHPGIINGKIIERSGPRPPGLIFFNHLGDEMGGLIFGDNGQIGHFGSLTWDKVRGDQTIGFRHLESDNGSYSTALEVWQQPDIPGDILGRRVREIRAMTDSAARRRAIAAMRAADSLGVARMYLGKAWDNSARLELFDQKGRPRLRLIVTPEGTPRIELLDEAGQVTDSLRGR